MLDIEELEPIIDEVKERIEKNMYLYNRLEELEEYLISINMKGVLDEFKQFFVMPRKNSRIVILGASEISSNQIYSILSEYGFTDDRVELCTDDEKLKIYDIENLKYTDIYCAVLVGPLPHSTSGTSHYASMIARLEQEEGFPKTIRLQAGQTLKITKGSLRNALEIYKNGSELNLESNILNNA